MPLKVCRNTAAEIRRQVRIVQNILPKLSPSEAQSVKVEIYRNIKIAAENDHIYHRDFDSFFFEGNGRAGERRG